MIFSRGEIYERNDYYGKQRPNHTEPLFTFMPEKSGEIFKEGVDFSYQHIKVRVRRN